MTTYRFKAVDRAGVPRSGELEAGSQSAVIEQLSARGLVATEVRSGASRWPTWLTEPVRLRRRVTARELLMITQELAALLRAGLNLDRALAIVRRLAGRVPVRAFLDTLLERLRAGQSFAESLAAERDVVPGHYVSLVRAGELGGSLPEVMTRLTDFLRRSQEIRERVRSALIYPCILAGVVFLTLIVVLTVVLPRFEALFAVAEAPLPLATRVVLAIGTTLSSYGWLLMLIILAAALVVWRRLRSPEGRVRFDRFLLRSRWTAGLPSRIGSARFLRTVGTLTANGLPLPTAVRVASDAIDNRALHAAAHQLATGLQEGKSLSVLLDAVGDFPKLAVQLARVGEETGKLADMIVEAADMLDREANQTIDRLLTLLVPTLTIGTGLIVALVIGSVLIGILSVNELAL